MKKSLLLILFVLTSSVNLYSQNGWTQITDTNNPVVTDSFPRGYPGTAWIDFDNDGILDLFANNDYLYKGLADGNFIPNLSFKGQTSPLVPPNGVVGSGSSWADYDNDGDLDMFIASGKSFLFRNDGGEIFTKITSGAIADSIGNRGWTCTWGDYDNDGNVDLLIVHPAGFVPGGSIPNVLFHNDGPPNYTFTKVTGYEFVTLLAPYTVATWSDYDMDGDIDLFIGSGPAGVAAKDYLYKNLLIDNGVVDFERITSAPLGTDLQDGQVYNWIDYDNDGDLDAFLTNYTGAQNRLYKNDNGFFTNVAGNLALPGVSCLANSWGDFDNDGFLDVVITSEGQTYYFKNNGDGTFENQATVFTQAAFERGVTIGDYENDGDLDIHISGFTPGRGIFRNDNANGNHWLILKLIGEESNKSAIGTRIKLKSMIGGTPMWQQRDVSAQNSFNGQNSLDVHFGLSDAAIIDSLIILWPSGNIDVLTNLPVDQYKTITEGDFTGVDESGNVTPDLFYLDQNYPNPFNPSTKISWHSPIGIHQTLKVYDVLGKEVATLVDEFRSAGNLSIEFDASKLVSGIYFYQLKIAGFVQTRKMILLK